MISRDDVSAILQNAKKKNDILGALLQLQSLPKNWRSADLSILISGLQPHIIRNGSCPGEHRDMQDSEHVIVSFVEELWNNRMLEVADKIFDQNCHTHQIQSGAPEAATPRGPEAVKAHVTAWLSGFPDLRFTTEQMFVDEDRAFSQLAMDETQTGH